MSPSKRALLYLSAWAVLAVIVALLKIMAASFDWPASYADLSFQMWFYSGLTLAGLALIDWIVLLNEPKPLAVRDVNTNVAVGSKTQVKIKLKHYCRRRLDLVVNDHYPEHSSITDLPQTVKLPAKQTATVTYHLSIQKRGDAQFSFVRILRQSWLGLWQQVVLASAPESVKVYPNFAAIHHYLLLSADQQQSQMGIRKSQRRGDGLEFHQLREYRLGDSLRQIDWRASSRLNKLISKEYQEEKDQNIVFLLDCGRRMRTQDDQLSHFDHSLNAMLLLAYIGLKQGDAVGLATFGGLSRWLPPQKGTYFINSLMNQVYDCHPTLNASDFIEAATTLNSKIRKRSLVVLISNCRNEDWIELEPAVRLLRQHHLVLLANLKEQSLESVLETPIEKFEDAQRYAETCQFIAQRQQLIANCVNQGVVTVDTTPKRLATEIVNEYFKIKRSGKL